MIEQDSSTTSTILIADDNPDNIRVLQGMLDESGYLVRVATNGELALKSAKASPPNLILLDIHMPRMDGYEACIRLKNDVDLKDIPVIFLSALSDNFNKLKAFELGAVDYIVKPFELLEVKARIQMHLKIRHQMAEIEAFNRSMMDREMRVIELKGEVNRLQQKMGEPISYPSVDK